MDKKQYRMFQVWVACLDATQMIEYRKQFLLTELPVCCGLCINFYPDRTITVTPDAKHGTEKITVVDNSKCFIQYNGTNQINVVAEHQGCALFKAKPPEDPFVASLQEKFLKYLENLFFKQEKKWEQAEHPYH